MSGGERQRIGIAQAPYKQARVLVLNGATSVLDNVTEQSVMDSIDVLDRDLTILIVAHRLTTVQWCDTIVELEGNPIVGAGDIRKVARAKSEFQTNGRSHPIGWRHSGPHPRPYAARCSRTPTARHDVQ